MSQSPHTESGGTATVVYGAIVGITVYVVGYLVTYATAASAVNRAVQGNVRLTDAGAASAPAWKAVGWVFYDAHLVGTRLPDEVPWGVGRKSLESPSTVRTRISKGVRRRE
jgi:hypothetical protein